MTELYLIAAVILAGVGFWLTFAGWFIYKDRWTWRQRVGAILASYVFAAVAGLFLGAWLTR
jgi:hypothetical protein